MKKLERCHFGCRGVRKANMQTTLSLYDKSNAFNTFDRKELVSRLEVGGDARKLVVNSIVDQSTFQVRTKTDLSKPFELRTGGPQGQCGTGDLFASLTKTLTPPGNFTNLEHPEQVKFSRLDYVDDSSDVTSANKIDIEKIHHQTEEKLARDCKTVGLKLNHDKTKKLVMGDPLQSEKFLGYQINNKMNANSELPIFLNRLKKVTNTTRSCTFLSKFDRMRIAKWQILSVLWPIVFLYSYLSQSNFGKARTAINVAFKSASYLSMQTPTIDIENYLYGMSFEDYTRVRYLKVYNRFIKMGSDIFDVFYERRGKFRIKPGCAVGKFVDKYRTDILNEKFNAKNLVKQKYKTQKMAYSNILEFQKHVKSFR